MKRVLLLFVVSLSLTTAFGQSVELGIPYQAVARDAAGQILSDLPLQVTIAFTDQAGGTTPYYLERHNIRSDASGYFELVIGRGDSRQGYLMDVPWSGTDIWLDITISSKEQPDLNLRRTTQLFSVPYALYAETARKLTEAKDVEPRNHSIYWNTKGNTNTRPPFHFVGSRDVEDLVVKTSGETRATFTSDGQLEIIAGSTVNGDQENPDSYPVTIKGAGQGIYIKVNGSRNSDNNFVTFKDAERIHGAIEGQTYIELISDPFYIIEAAVYVIDGVGIVADGIAAGVKVGGFGAAVTAAAISIIFSWQVPGWALSAIGEGVKVGAAIVDAAALLTNSISWATDQALNVGVAYNSGGADYAEFLPRAAYADLMEFGDIVGVRGGKVSHITEAVDQLMVISRNPGFLGNVPADGDRDAYEKVAFLGQVLVKVAGAVRSGDYILPSGNNDGMGIAVHPEDMRMVDYDRIVGVAWESADAAPVNLVNCSIGLTQNELAPKVEEISNKVDNIINHLKGEGPLRPERTTTDYTSPQALFVGENGPEKVFTNAEFDNIVDQNADYLQMVYTKAENDLRASGSVDIEAIPELQSFFKDPVGQLKKCRRDPQYDALMGKLDQFFMQQFNINKD